MPIELRVRNAISARLETIEYEKMDSAEDHLWWYRALHGYLLDALKLVKLPAEAMILDAGCGTGGLLRAIGTALPANVRVGLDLAVPAAIRASAKSGAAIGVGSVDSMPFRANSFGVVVSADVLYHRNVDPHRALAEAFRCLSPGGVLLVNVPAFSWLSSYHDRRVHGARRFTRGPFKQLLSDAGFKNIQLHYWNSLLFPVMVARRLRPGAAHASSDTDRLPGPLNALLCGIVALERRLIRWGLRFPAGGSLLALAYKP